MDVDVFIESKVMDAVRNFKIHLLFFLLECVMLVVSVEPHSKIKGKNYIL